MSERELVKVRALKEAAHALYVRGRFSKCAETYAHLLQLAPKDPTVRVRHAEACRRAGDRQPAIASYREAAELLVALGCESKARAVLKAALELDPRDPILLSDLKRLSPGGRNANPVEDDGSYNQLTCLLAPLEIVETPPAPPPLEVLNAAREAPRPLPSAPAIAPVSLEAIRRTPPVSPATMNTPVAQRVRTPIKQLPSPRALPALSAVPGESAAPRREAQRAAGAPPVLVPAQGRSPAAHAATPAPRTP
ncbi:hypothetical protein KRR26_22700, partial [Corallococcus sp. M34]|nr:hypothetical protein [Citreicoccus inhibens]